MDILDWGHQLGGEMNQDKKDDFYFWLVQYLAICAIIIGVYATIFNLW